jgi:glutaredoxin
VRSNGNIHHETPQRVARGRTTDKTIRTGVPVARIKVFALSTCPYCNQARTYLRDNGVEFDVVEVDKLEGQARADAVDEVKRLSGGTSFPVVVAEGTVVVGFDKAGLGRLAGI